MNLPIRTGVLYIDIMMNWYKQANVIAYPDIILTKHVTSFQKLIIYI